MPSCGFAEISGGRQTDLVGEIEFGLSRNTLLSHLATHDYPSMAVTLFGGPKRFVLLARQNKGRTRLLYV